KTPLLRKHPLNSFTVASPTHLLSTTSQYFMFLKQIPSLRISPPLGKKYKRLQLRLASNKLSTTTKSTLLHPSSKLAKWFFFLAKTSTPKTQLKTSSPLSISAHLKSSKPTIAWMTINSNYLLILKSIQFFTSPSYVLTIQMTTSASHLASTIDHHLFQSLKIKNPTPILSKPSWTTATTIVPRLTPIESVGKVTRLPKTP